MLISRTATRTVDKGCEFVHGDFHFWLGLAEKGDDGVSRVAADDWDIDFVGILGASEILNEGLGSDNVKSGNTEQLLGVKDSGSFERLCCDRDGGVDRVGDDEDVGVGAELRNTCDQCLHNAGVDLEEIISGHAWLSFVKVSTAQDM